MLFSVNLIKKLVIEILYKEQCESDYVMQGSVSQWSNPVRSVRESGTQQRNQWRNISPASLSWPAPDPQLPRRLDLAEAGYLGRVSEPGVSTHSLWWVSVLWRLIRSAGGRWGKCLISRLCVREREMMKCSPCHSAHESSIYTRTARARCWLVTSAIPRIHPSVGPSHTIMLSNKIVPFLSRTPNTTDFIHASRWPHPSPGFLLAGHKVRSQWQAGNSQQFCAMERSVRDPLPSGLRSPWSARGRSGPWPADGSQDLFWQLAARRAAAASSMRLQRKWIWTGYSSSSSVVSAALSTIWSQLAPAVRQLRLSWANNSACNSSSSFDKNTFRTYSMHFS